MQAVSCKNLELFETLLHGSKTMLGYVTSYHATSGHGKSRRARSFKSKSLGRSGFELNEILGYGIGGLI